MSKGFKIEAHRIFGAESVQNSISAMKLAAPSPFLDSIETDVYFSKDKEMFILHGDTDFGAMSFKPLGSGEEVKYTIGAVGLMTAQQLDNVFYEKSGPEKVPRLDELLAAFKGSGKRLNIEIKDYSPEITKRVIDKFIAHEMLPQLFLSSFYHYHKKIAIDYLKSLGLPAVSFGFLTPNPVDASLPHIQDLTSPGDFVTLSAVGYMINKEYAAELMSVCQKNGVNIAVWFEGLEHRSGGQETIENYRILKEMGVSTIITNLPSVAFELNKQLIQDSEQASK